ncbi:unnamed protein product [Ectocarpus sp. CCAP 1310/34]|nr:unnamed protein product [Ectocarpus sp. CCAP 1310/34]
MQHEADMMLSSSTNRWRKRPPNQAGGATGGGSGSSSRRSPNTTVADRRHLDPPPAVSVGAHSSSTGAEQQPHQFYYPATAGVGGGGHHLPATATRPFATNAAWVVKPASYSLPPSNTTAAAVTAAAPARAPPSSLTELHPAEDQQLSLAPGQQPPSQQPQAGGRRRQGRGGYRGSIPSPPPLATQQFETCRQQQQQPQQQQPQPSGGGGGGNGRGSASAGTIATLILASLITYALYNASVEALAGQRTRLSIPRRHPSSASAGGASLIGTSGRDVPAEIVTTGGAAGAAAADNTALLEDEDDHLSDGGIGFKVEYYERVPTAVSWGGGANGGEGGGGGAAVAGWGKGVSVVTVSAWQTLAALGFGFLMSRFWRRFRRPEVRALSDGERTRRNKFLLVFAAAHLAGTGLEYHGYGVIGAAAAEVLRSTEAACFCLLSLNVGMQRPGLASVPTLLLALGLALAATPTAGDLRAGWGGLRASLAANILLAVRAIAAKMALDDYGLDEISALFSGATMTAGLQSLILLVVEVPRAAAGLSPRLLPHLWGVGVMEIDRQQPGGPVLSGEGAGIGVGDAGDWGEGRERARLACLLLANGVFLYGHLLVLFALLSRLSATMFAISSGYVHAALVFVLLLALRGSAAGPRMVGMSLATLAVSAHFYRAYVRGRATSSLLNSADNADGLPCDADDGGEAGGDATAATGGEQEVISFVPPSPPPHRRRLPRLLRRDNDTPPAAAAPLSSSSCSSSYSGPAGGDGGRREDHFSSPPGCRPAVGMTAGGGGGGGKPGLFVPLLGTKLGDRRRGVDGSGGGGGGSWGGSTNSSSLSAPAAAAAADGDGAPPSGFAWRWMGLRPSESAVTPPVVSAAGQLADKRQQQQRLEDGVGDVGIDGNFGLPSRQLDHHGGSEVLSPPAAFATASADSFAADGSRGQDGGDYACEGRRKARSPQSGNHDFPTETFVGVEGTVETAPRRFGAPSPGSQQPYPPVSASSNSNSSSSSTAGSRSTGLLQQQQQRRRRSASRSVPFEPPPPSFSSPAIAGTATTASNSVAFAARRAGAPPTTAPAGYPSTTAAAAGGGRWGEEPSEGVSLPAGRRGSGHGLGGTAAGVPRPFRRLGGDYVAGPREEEGGIAAGFRGATVGGGSRGLRTEDGEGGAGGRQVSGTGATLSSPSTSSSSFSLNGFEVIDKEEDMWT